jgi:hypothetical protein
MNEAPRGIEKATQEDGFVNFYTAFGLTPAAPAEEIQETLNAKFQEAQNNRDHRVPARRREYQLLLETLPQARTILLDAARRKRYDAYCQAREMGSPHMPYAEFLSGLLREKDVEEVRADILTLRDLSRLRLVTPEPQNPVTEISTPGTVSPVQKVTVAEEIQTPTPTMEKSAPVEAPRVSSPPATRFPLAALAGGAMVLGGLLACLPTLAGVPPVLTAPLALVSAGVTAYVFALAARQTSV